MSLISPITGLPAKEFNILNPKKIIQCYSDDLGIDVSSYFKNIEKVLIGQCIQTGLLFYYPDYIDGDEVFYGELVEKMRIHYGVSYYSLDKWEYNVALEYLEKRESLYEVGSGIGNFLKKLKEKGFNDIAGSEFSTNAINLAEERGIALERISIEDKAKARPRSVDAVVSFQVLEHIAKPNIFLNGCIELLKPGGKLILAVPYNNPYLFGNDIYNTLNMPPHHMLLWSEHSFKKIPDYFDLKLVDLKIETLHKDGYDFDRFFSINRSRLVKENFWLRVNSRDSRFWNWAKKNHSNFPGKNILVVFQKNK